MKKITVLTDQAISYWLPACINLNLRNLRNLR